MVEERLCIGDLPVARTCHQHGPEREINACDS